VARRLPCSLDAARRVGGAKAPDEMIAGVAIERGLRVLTTDADFAPPAIC
jgi:predicted nucleic acid-binding protein